MLAEGVISWFKSSAKMHCEECFDWAVGAAAVPDQDVFSVVAWGPAG